ncbi:BlaI/MecI/CopY family transcriptional regulator [Streptomyces sp. NPDC087862]|uniref:BlaI/MecI/CopY family transcriptional regulator n=1 Tax=Streptomyces sp. NPDC087862 TaxID=3365813 RepID=UPI003830DD80
MPRPLGDLEDAVMTRVWQWNRPVTVREVLEDLQQERSIAYTTVMTVMDNLHQKGWVRREVDGRAYRYTAVSTRAAYAAALMNEAWSRSDNPAAALVAFFGMMSAEQREALQDAMRVVQPKLSGAAGPPPGGQAAERSGEQTAGQAAEQTGAATGEPTGEPAGEPAGDPVDGTGPGAGR